jgi:ketol-acid reductoisomerase
MIFEKGEDNMTKHKDYLDEKTVAILGYNIDGQEQAQKLKNRGIKVVIGLREGDPFWSEAEKDGYSVFNLWTAVGEADIIQVWY